MSLTLTVQSNIVDGDELTSRIETFLSGNFLPFLEAVPDIEFESYKEGIISRLREPDQRLTSQAGRFWMEIVSTAIPSSSTVEFETPIFNRRLVEARFLESVSKKDLISFAKDLLSKDGTNRRLLVSQVSSTKKNQLMQKTVHGNISKFDYVDILDTRQHIQNMQLL